MEVGGQVLGVLCASRRTRRTPWAAESQQQLRTLAEVLANALQRQQTAANVSESDRLKGAILSSMSAHITVLDRHGTIIAVNEAWTRVRPGERRAGGSRRSRPAPTTSRCAGRAADDGRAGRPGGARGHPGGLRRAAAPRSELEYRCDAPGIERWFEMKVAAPAAARRRRGRHAPRDHRGAAARDRAARERGALPAARRRPAGRRLDRPTSTGSASTSTARGWSGRAVRSSASWATAGRNASTRATPAGPSGRLQGGGRRPGSRSRPSSASSGRDGRFRWVLNHGRPRYDDEGEVLGYVGGAIDMTERLEAQAQPARAERAADHGAGGRAAARRARTARRPPAAPRAARHRTRGHGARPAARRPRGLGRPGAPAVDRGRTRSRAKSTASRTGCCR